MVSFVFFGTSDNSIIVLDKLIKSGYKCSAVITIPDKPIGRKQILTPSPVKLYAQKNNIPVFSTSNLNDLSNTLNIPNKNTGGAGGKAPDSAQRFFASTGGKACPERAKRVEGETRDRTRFINLGIVADFGLLIPAELIKTFPRGILNLHPSLLPAYQGATPAPIQILRGKKQGGITIITINERFDEGSILAQQKFPINKNETTVSLLLMSFTLGAQLLVNLLPNYLTGKLKPLPQNLTKKSYFPRLSRDDGFISWNTLKKAVKGNSITESEKPRFMQISKSSVLSSQFIVERAIRALTPWPGVWTEITIKDQLKRLKLLKSHIKGNKLILDLVQLEGKNPVSWSQFQQAYQNDII